MHFQSIGEVLIILQCLWEDKGKNQKQKSATYGIYDSCYNPSSHVKKKYIISFLLFKQFLIIKIRCNFGKFQQSKKLQEIKFNLIFQI